MKRPYRVLMSILALTALAESAYATVTFYVQDYMGSRCVEIGDATPSIYYWSSLAENDSASEQDFYCPVNFEHSMDIGNLAFEADELTWSAYVDDSSSTANVSCVLKNCTEDFSSCASSGTSTSSGSSGVQSMAGSSLSTLAGSGNYVSHLRCDIPGKVSSNRSGIVSYRITTDGVN